ncbi:hypothetical protein [Sigmofec virus UA08Rod_5342]|uniref:Uncharacterized protein n=1 Tax=Sigmofec virus UA08Rod_5342 TaxID=2929420 RepID=A0A976R7D6_9VIRU|nr:hypothetical protein [Sigmofec virus UA08Rod_5342]
MKMQKLKTNLIRQNCYLSVASPAPIDLKKDYLQEKYLELNEHVDSDGSRREVLEEIPYPITPESVKSYAEGCDYKRDPLNAVANSVPRQNLGDLTSVYDIFSKNPSDVKEFIQTINQKYADYVASKNVGEIKDKESEVKENG